LERHEKCKSFFLVVATNGPGRSSQPVGDEEEGKSRQKGQGRRPGAEVWVQQQQHCSGLLAKAEEARGTVSTPANSCD